MALAAPVVTLLKPMEPSKTKASHAFIEISSGSETEWTSASDWAETDDFDWVPAEYRCVDRVDRVDRIVSKRRRCGSSWLSSATSLGGHPRMADLYGFMYRRETARIRKEMGLPSDEWYAEGDLMRSVFLTNVRREDDVTTRAVRAALQPALEAWKELSGPHSKLRLAGLMVFHCALWRAFGTKEFIHSLGFMEFETWDESAWRPVVDVAMSCWQKGILCFSQAYCPSRTWRKRESSAARNPRPAIGQALVRSLFQEVCQVHLGSLWERRYDIVRAAEDGYSWQQVVRAIMTVPNYGGTGFLAKELAQDLLKTPLFCTWNSANGSWENRCQDLNDWCPVGPGARRALNRLHGRPTKENCYSSSRAVQESFVQELLDVYAQRQLFWNPSHMIDDWYPSGELTLHDVQFQLCEFDKYERAKHNEGFVRRYVPSDGEPRRDQGDQGAEATGHLRVRCAQISNSC